MADAEEDKDDLWDFSTPGGAEPIQLSDSDNDEDDDDVDGLRALPASKRRKLQKKLIVVPDLVIVDDSSDEEPPDPDLAIVEEIKRKKAKQAKRLEEIEFLDLANMVPASGSLGSEKYEATQAELEDKLARLAEVKAMLHAEPLETPESVDPMEERQQIEDVREGEGGEPQANPEMDRIIIKVQPNRKSDPIKLRVGKRNQLEKLFAAFEKRAEELGWLTRGTPIRFVFDGEAIRPTDTPEELDIEEDCIIEAHWQEL